MIGECNVDGIANIAEFFTKLNNKLKEHCFVSGTYIFEGDHMFKFLEPCSKIRFGQQQMTPQSHNLHIKDTLFQEHKLNHNDSSIDEQNTTKQFEVDLGDYKIAYPCNKEYCNELQLESTKEKRTVGGSSNLKSENENELYMYDNFIQEFPAFKNFYNTDKPDEYRNNLLLMLKQKYCSLNREEKKSVLFYKFTVLTKFSTDETIQTTYTFVKLETKPTTNLRDAIDHGIHAFKHYFTKTGANRSNTWSIRREDMLSMNPKKENEKDNKLILGTYKPSEVEKCTKVTKNKAKNECTMENHANFFKTKKTKKINYIPFDDIYPNATVGPAYSYKEEDAKLYKGNDPNKISDNLIALNFYNDYVRTRNEMFVPFGFYQDILNKCLIKGGSTTNKKMKHTKTDKKFPYNNHEYTVYRYKSTRKEFIILKREHVLCRTLKRQKNKKIRHTE